MATLKEQLSSIAAQLDDVIASMPDDPKPPPLVVSIEGPTTVTVGDTVMYTAKVTGGVPPYDVVWRVFNGTFEGDTYTTKFNEVGLWSLICDVIDDTGDFAQSHAEINVKGVTPPLGTTINVGPSGEFKELHEVPFGSLQPNTTVNVVSRATPYRSKLVLNRGVEIKGIADAIGERPILDSADAIENTSYAIDWTSQLVGKGLISIIKPNAGSVVSGVKISGFELRGCRRTAKFKHKSGSFLNYNEGCAGVYAVTCDGVEIDNCVIENNENGVFAVTNDSWGSVKNLTLRRNTIKGNGVNGSFLQHGTYIEGIGTVYQFNRYEALTNGAAGALLKDRSAGAVIACNEFYGPTVRALDLVEPEAGAATLKASPLWGKTFVHSNLIRNNLDCSLIHFGFDGTPANTQIKLLFYHNTLINTGDNWKCNWFRLHGSPSYVLSFNNIFWNNSTDAMRYYSGQGASDNWIQGCWLSTGTSQTADDNTGQPLNPGLSGWLAQKFGSDPGLNQDGTLKSDSPCKGIAVPLEWISAPYPSHGWSGSAWTTRNDFTSAGCAV